MSEQIQQRSPEWHKQRAKKFTGSKIVNLCADGSRKMTEEELAQHKIDFPKSRKTTTWDIPEGLKTYALEKAIDFFYQSRRRSIFKPSCRRRSGNRAFCV